MPEIHPNYIKAQRLMIFLLIASLIYLFLSPTYGNRSGRDKILMPVVFISVIGLQAYLLGKGYSWMKYVMAVLFLSSFVKPSTITHIANLNFTGVIAMAFRMAINLWILWLLFKVPNTMMPNEKGPDLPEPL